MADSRKEETPLLALPRPSGGSKRSTVRLTILIMTIAGIAFTLLGFATHSFMQHQSSAEDTASKRVQGETRLELLPPLNADASPVRSRSGVYSRAAVASDHELCSQIGTAILQQGGSAVDSAISTMLCLGVANAESSGIFGGGYMAVFEKPRDGQDQVLYQLDFGSEVPVTAKPEQYKGDPSKWTATPATIGTPGELWGYYTAWKKFGRLPWKDLFQPAIKLCMEGFPVGAFLADISKKEKERKIMKNAELQKIFLKPDGSVIEEGDILLQPDLGLTLQRIAEGGPEVLYGGSLGEDILADIRDAGGILTMEDLLAFKVIEAPNVNINLSNGEYNIPSNGPSLTQFVLQILNGYEYQPDRVLSKDEQVLFYHRLVEAIKYAHLTFLSIAQYGGADFHEGFEKWLQKKLLDGGFAEEIRKGIDDNKASNIEGVAQTSKFLHEMGLQSIGKTTYLSVYTEEGSAVSAVTSINDFFGCGIRGARTGVIFNSHIQLFTVDNPNSWLRLVPGNRGIKGLTPSIVFDKLGKVKMVVGGSGAGGIFSAVPLVTASTLWLGNDITRSVDIPRVHVASSRSFNEVICDTYLPQYIQDGLASKGHPLVPLETFDYYIAVVQAIHIQDCKICPQKDKNSNSCRCVHAVSDRRKYGVPDGY